MDSAGARRAAEAARERVLSEKSRRAPILLAAVLGVVISAPRLLRELEATVKAVPAPTVSAGEVIASVLSQVSGAAPSPGA